jgi:hypothetical protein
MPRYMEEERRATEKYREEHLDWLHQQAALLGRQAETLDRIARHTSLLYGIAVAWIVLVIVTLLYWLIELSTI